MSGKYSAEKNYNAAEQWQNKFLRANSIGKSTFGFYSILRYIFLLKILFISLLTSFKNSPISCNFTLSTLSGKQ